MINPKMRISTVEHRKFQFGNMIRTKRTPHTLRIRTVRSKRIRGHTRDRAWRMGPKDPTAIVPVVVGDAIPTGSLRGRRRWARRLLRSHVQVEWIDPTRRQLRRSCLWTGRRGWWWSRFESKKPRLHVLRVSEKLAGSILSRSSPSLQAGQLVDRLGHQGFEALELPREVVHGGGHVPFKLGGLPRRQVAVAQLRGTGAPFLD